MMDARDSPARAPDGPEVSVVIPTRNRRRLLSLALASVLDQRDVRLEVIVVDEASTDDTIPMIGSIADPRLRLVRHDTPRGKAAARNRGIAEAQGEWVAFLDDDDLWAADKLLLQLRALRATGRTWAYTGAVNITEDHRILGGAPPRAPDDVAQTLHRVNGVPGGCSSVVARRDSLPAEGFDGQYRLCEDWDLWIRLARTGLPAYVPKPLVGYRVHSGNSSIDTAQFLIELGIIEQRYGGPVDRVVFYRHLARVCLRMNRQRSALGFYLRAAAHDPGSYATRGFIPDVMGVCRSFSDRIRNRMGAPRRRDTRSTDTDMSWHEQARPWIEQFVRRHVT
jgi:glycosyltransferase involved in cell wall biosynthesis